MTTDALRPESAGRDAQQEQATALKALIGSLSLAATLVGWAWLSHQQAATAGLVPAEPTDLPSPPPTLDVVATSLPAVSQPLPTLAPLYMPKRINMERPAPSKNVAPPAMAPRPQQAAPQVAPAPAQPQMQLRVVAAPPPPPRPVAITRSSR